MATPAQIGIGAGAIAAVSLGGYAIYYTTSSDGTNKTDEPSGILTFKHDITFTEKDYLNKVLGLIKKDNLSFLVVPKPDLKNKDFQTQNELWWEWAYENNYKSNNKDEKSLDASFSGIKRGYSENSSDIDALNQACEKAYKKEKVNYKVDGSTNLLKNIGEFCTVGKNPVDILEPDATTYKTENSLSADYEWGVLKKEKNKKHLVKKDNNDLWWEWAYHNLYKNKKPVSSSLFNAIEKSTSPTNTDLKALNNVCDSSYKKEHDDLKGSDEKNKLLNEIAKYCSVDIKVPTLELPEKDTEPKKNKHVLSDAKEKSTYNAGLAKTDLGNQDKLIDPIKPENKDWWNWAYRNRYKKRVSNFDVHEDFQNLEMGYDESKTKALNIACKTAYGKGKNDDKLVKNVKEFCTKEKEDLTKPT